jgi:hypothetical protein
MTMKGARFAIDNGRSRALIGASGAISSGIRDKEQAPTGLQPQTWAAMDSKAALRPW